MTSTSTFTCPPEHAHGANHTCYTAHRCRCMRCRATVAKEAARRRNLKALGAWPSPTKPATGARRRIQALVVNGWAQQRLAQQLGLNPSNFHALLHDTRQNILTATHNAVDQLFEELWNQNPPARTSREKQSVSRARRYAAARGWLPAMAWDDIDTDVEPPQLTTSANTDQTSGDIDEVAIELAMTGERITLSHAELSEAIRRLNAQKYTDPDIARQLHVDARTVLRHRQNRGIRAAVGYDGMPVAS